MHIRSREKAVTANSLDSFIYQTNMSRLIILLFVQALCLSVFSGNITKKYKTHNTERGTVYFIMPQKMDKASGSTAQKELLFDVTSLITTDSIHVTATISAKEPVTDSIVTIRTADGHAITAPAEFLYRELGKKGYVNRVRFGMLRSDFKSLFAAPSSFTLDYGKGYLFAFPKGKWAKEQELVNNILGLMELNR